MRRHGLWLIGLVALAGCEEQQPLVSADCRDGSRIFGARDVAEGRCARRGGIGKITDMNASADAEPPASPAP